MNLVLRFIASGIVLALFSSCGTARTHGGKEGVIRQQAVQSQKTPYELARSMSSIAPWSSVVLYSGRDWAQILDVAKELNQADTNEVRQAFDIFASRSVQPNSAPFLEVSKAFILLRVMYQYPNTKVQPIAGWLAHEKRVTSGWPVAWENGQPKLLSPYVGYEGPIYNPAFEYDEVAAMFAKRDPNALQKAILQIRNGAR